MITQHSQVISIAHRTDVGAISDLFREIITPLPFMSHAMKMMLLAHFADAGLAAKMQDSQWQILLSRVGRSGISGCVFACRMTPKDYVDDSPVTRANALWVYFVGVSPIYRGQKLIREQTISDHFLTVLKAGSKESQIQRMEALILPENTAGKRLFERNGYKHVCTDTRSGVTYDHYHLQLRPRGGH